MKKSTLITFLIFFLVTAVIQAQDTLNFECAQIPDTVYVTIDKSCEGTYIVPDMGNFIFGNCGEYAYQIFTTSGQVVDNRPIDSFIEVHELPLGATQISILAQDTCGNTESCSQIVVVKDDKEPTPYCLNGIVTTNLPVSRVLNVFANDFDAGSFDNCTSAQNLHFSFSRDITDTVKEFNEDILNGIGRNVFEISLWVTDQSGNQDFCKFFLEIEDGNSSCQNDSIPPIAICNQNVNITDIADTIWFDEHVELFDDGSFDNCSEIRFSFEPPYATCGNFPAQVLMRVTDVGGNTNTCMINLTNEGRTDMICRETISQNVFNFPSLISAFDVLEGGKYSCASNFELELATDQNFSNVIRQGIGQVVIPDSGSYFVRISNIENGNSCWTILEASIWDMANFVNISGHVDGPLSTTVRAYNSAYSQTVALDAQGNYSLLAPKGEDITIQPIPKNDDYLIGVSTLDILLMERHIKGVQALQHPRNLIAANVNSDNRITGSDIVGIEQLILGTSNGFPNSTNSWKFYPASSNLPWGVLPVNFDQHIELKNVQSDNSNLDFKAVKIGDINTHIEDDCIQHNLTCNGNVNISAIEDCPLSINVDDLLEGFYSCYDNYLIEVAEDDNFNNIIASGFDFVEVNIGSGIYYARVTDSVTGNSCWTTLNISTFNPPNFILNCRDTLELGCQSALSYSNLIETSVFCHKDIQVLIWEDSNRTEFIDTLKYREEFDLNPFSIVFVELIDLTNDDRCLTTVFFSGGEELNADSLFSTIQDVTVSCLDYQIDPEATIHPNRTGQPNLGSSKEPFVAFGYRDKKIDSAGCGIIIRTWTVVNWCTNKSYSHEQIIFLTNYSQEVCAFTISGEGIVDVVMDSNLITSDLGCVGFDYADVSIFEPYKIDSSSEGIDAFDVITLLDFVLGLDTLTPFQQFAADLNHDGVVNTDDLALMRQWLRNEAIPQGQMWFFFDDQQFNTQIDLFVDTPAQFIEVDSMVRTDYEFVGIKKGDLNHNYASSNLQVEGEYLVMFKDDIINAGQQYSMEVKAGEFAELQTLDLAIAFDESRVNLLYIESEFLSDFNISEDSNGDVEIEFIASIQELLLGGVEVQEGDVLFELVFEAKVNSILSEEFALNQNHQNIVKQSNLTLPNNVVTEWEDKLTTDAIQHWVSDVVIYPNPTSDVIYIDAKEEGMMNYKLMDLSGRLVLEGKTRANEVIDLSQVASGMYLFEVIDQKSIRSISKLKVF